MVRKANKAVENWVKTVQAVCTNADWVSVGSPRALMPVCKHRKNAIAKCVYKHCPKVTNKVINE